MKKFKINNDFLEIFPDARIGVLIVNNVDNSRELDLQKEIDEAMEFAKNSLSEDNFIENEVVKKWREAYTKFKKKKGARSSIEALLKRAYNESGLSTINPLVDLYNITSLRYGIPCGGEDIDCFSGDLYLTKALGDEPFEALGDDKIEFPYLDEIVYKDNDGIICRCFNWRETKRTMLTSKTNNALLVLEVLDENDYIKLDESLEYLKHCIFDNLGISATSYLLDKENTEIIIDK